VKFTIKAHLCRRRNFLFGSEEEIPNLGMASTFLMNLFYSGHITLVGFKDLMKETNASSSYLKGVSIL
jgi:hypothetical protein